jgi:hypothetical protein
MVMQNTWLELDLSVRWMGRSLSTGLPASARDFTNSYMNTRTWGLQVMDMAVTTYRLPLNHGASSHSKVPVYPSTMPVYKETTHIPPVL